MTDPLRFGLGPAVATDEHAEARERFGERLGAALGREVAVRTAGYYQDLELHLDRHEVDVAWLPPAVFVRREPAVPLRPVVAVERAADGRYHGALFVREGRTGPFPEGLRGTTVGWADGTSCAGYLFPRFAMVERGFHPDRYFGEELVLGSHAEVVQAVAAGWVDVGATYVHLEDDGRTIARAAWEDIEPAVAMRPVLLTKPIPSDVVAGRAEVVDELGGALAQALRALTRDDEGAQLARRLFGAQGFADVDRRAYDVVRSALNVAHLPRF